MVDPRFLPMQSATSNHGGKTGRRRERRDAGKKKGNLAISFSFSPSYKTHTQRYINTDKHKPGGRMLVVLT